MYVLLICTNTIPNKGSIVVGTVTVRLVKLSTFKC